MDLIDRRAAIAVAKSWIAVNSFPAQVTRKNCHHCKINIYPSQTKFIGEEGNDKGDAE